MAAAPGGVCETVGLMAYLIIIIVLAVLLIVAGGGWLLFLRPGGRHALSLIHI